MGVAVESLVSYAKSKGVKIYYVGGIVRDMLLGCVSRCDGGGGGEPSTASTTMLPSKDVDIVVEGDAIEFCKGLKNAEILSAHPDFGTCKVRINDVEIDFASTREEVYPQSGSLPVVQNIGCELYQDIMRRDFTINAIAINLDGGTIIDYKGGVEDLKAKKLKILYPESFIDDPTRILRALDFELRFGFKLVDEVQFAKSREGLSMSRVDLTLKKLFSGATAAAAYQAIIERELYKIFQDVAPQIAPQKLKEAIEKFGAGENPCAIYLKAVKNELPALITAKTNYETYKALRPLIKEIRPNITGDDLMAQGVPEGPKIGEILEEILEKQINSL